MKIITWNNEKAGTPEGHWFDDIMNNIKVGDKHISGLGIISICTWVDRKEDAKYGGMVTIRETKSDGTPHMGRKPVDYIKWNGCWEKCK